jgi:hypothetical protein
MLSPRLGDQAQFESREPLPYVGGGLCRAKAGCQIGKLETASGGTIFLEEIGELPIALYPKLLRPNSQHSPETHNPRLNNAAMKSVHQLRSALHCLKLGDPVVLQIKRQGVLHYVL